MKHVEIRNQYGKIMGTYEQLNCSLPALRQHCSSYGPGVYTAKWKKRKNVEGAPRKVVQHSKTVYIYGEEQNAPASRSGQVIYPVAAYGVSNAGIAELLEKANEKILAAVDEKISALVPDGDDGDDDDDDETPEPTRAEIILEKAMATLQSGKYSGIIDATLTSQTDEESFQKIDSIIAQNPGLIREAILDILEIFRTA